MKRMKVFTVLLLTLFLLPACVVDHGDFTVLSNKLIRTSDFDLSKADRKQGVEGREVDHIIIFIPTGQPTLEGAVDNALFNGQGDVLTDASVESWGWYIPYIYGQMGWYVKGDVVKTRTR